MKSLWISQDLLDDLALTAWLSANGEFDTLFRSLESNKGRACRCTKQRNATEQWSEVHWQARSSGLPSSNTLHIIDNNDSNKLPN